MKITRRRFTTLLGTGAMSLAAPPIVLGQGTPKVVVVGGGAGGATVARYLAKDAGDALDVTLVDASDTYTTCFYSNLYFGGVRDRAYITHSWDTLVDEYGITKVTARATEIDRAGRTVTLDDGSTLSYDRLVVAPGIEMMFDSVPGYSEAAAEIAPHAWQGGPQTDLLKTKIDALENGDNVVMVAPPNPYRCPPGPYERASMIAHVFKTKGFTDSRITILDPKPKFSKQGLFAEGWEKHYPGIVEWIPAEMHGGVIAVDVEAGTVETDLDIFEGQLLNIIPAQQAGAIATAAGLADDSGFCPVDPDSMRSTLDENIFVIGDASIAGAMPKSGFAANSQAKVAALHVRGDLLDARTFPAKYANTCWSLIDAEDAVKVGASYEVVDGAIAATTSFVSQTSETDEVRRTTYEESIAWYESMTKDMFG